MLNINEKRRWIGTLSVALVMTAIALNALSASQTIPAASNKCVPLPVFTPEPKFHPLKAGTPVGAPALELRVADDGTVGKARLIRTSNGDDMAVFEGARLRLQEDGSCHHYARGLILISPARACAGGQSGWRFAQAQTMTRFKWTGKATHVKLQCT